MDQFGLSLAIKELANSIGVAEKEILPFYIKKMILTGYSYFICNILFIIAIAFLSKLFKSMKDTQLEMSDTSYSIITKIVIVGCLIASCAIFFEAISYIYTPEAHSFQLILKTLKGN